MSTQAQIAANQANAQHSTGPRTEDGKSAASKNSIKHGLTAKAVLVTGEDPDQFQAHLEEYAAQHNPITIDEKFLVNQMAEAMWRLNRVQRLEQPLFNNAPLANPFTDPDFSNELLKLARYQKSLESTYFRASRELRTIRKEQTGAVQKQEEQAVAEVKAEKKQQVAEFSAALDEIMYAPLPAWQDTYEMGPDGRPTKRTQSKKQKS